MRFHPKTLLKRFLLVFSFGISALAVQAQDGKDLYAKVSPQVVYLRHEFYLAPELVAKSELWTRLERIIKIKLLSNWLPVMTGTGFFVDDSGHMITNRHVVRVDSVESLRRSSRYYLEEVINENTGLFSSAERDLMKKDLRALYDKNEYRISAMVGDNLLGVVKVLAVESIHGPDLALIEVPGYKSSPLVIARDDDILSSIVGRDVFSFGYPIGTTIDSFFKERVVTMNRGNISAFRISELLDIQHSAAISNGNSGGPLLDARGQVLGVNTGIYDSKIANSLYYAVSSLKIRKFLADNGYGNILLWNARLGSMDGMENAGMAINAAGEIECPGVVVVSVPQNTEVLLDGKKIGLGQQALTLENPLSTLELVSADLRKSFKLRLVASLKGPAMFSPSMEAKFAAVDFTSDPPGAAVIADNRLLGTTPLKAFLPGGTYNVGFELAGHAFPYEKIEIDGIQERAVHAAGKVSYPVTVLGVSPQKDAMFLFESGNKVYAQKYAAVLQLPPGAYELEVTGIDGLKDIKIPVEMGEGPMDLDLSKYMKMAALDIRGLTKDATVWVDGVKFSVSENTTLSLTVDTHTVSVWQEGLFPIVATRIAVVEAGDSFITWKHAAGFDRKQKIYTWTGITVGTVGLLVGSIAIFMGQNDFAVSQTNSYDDYKTLKENAISAQIWGFSLASGALIPAFLAIRSHKAFDAQMKEIQK